MICGSRSGFMKKLHLHNNESLFVWRLEYALGRCVNFTHFVVSCFHLILLFYINTQWRKIQHPMANTWRKSPSSKCAKAFQTPHQKPPLAPFIAGFSFLQACSRAYNCQARKGSLQYSRKGSSSLYWVQNGKNLG